MKKTLLFPLIIALVAGFFIGCSSDDNGGDTDTAAGTITGTVATQQQDQTLLGLQGAEVKIFAADTLNTSVFTDAEGGYTVLGLLPGFYDIEVDLATYVSATVNDVEVEAGVVKTVDIELMAEASESAGIRINSGGPALTAEGMEWLADDYFVNGSAYGDEVEIANTDNPALYQTERYAGSGSLTYEIPVENGTYAVNLHFAEIFFGLPGAGSAGGEGSRVFDVDIENAQQQLTDYDIVVAAGGSATAVVESFTDILVEDGSLTITLTSVVENAKISGIEVVMQ